MVVTVQYENWVLKRVLIDPDRLINILFHNDFQRLWLDGDNIKAFQGSLVGILGEHVQLKDHITLKTMFGPKASSKIIKVKYLVVDVLYPYNAILRRPALNLLGTVQSTLQLILKY